MTYRVEIDGMAVPESMTAGAASHEDAALRVAQFSYAGKIITVETVDGEEWAKFRLLIKHYRAATQAIARAKGEK